MNIHAVGPEQANALRLAPWGHPPTPLLPRWYRENFAHHRLPARIRRLNPAVARIGDLGTFWVQFQRPLDKASIRSLAHLAGTRRPPPDFQILPVDFDLDLLLSIPLKPRTLNCIVRALHRNRLKDRTVAEFMGLTNFGILSLLDLMCVTELVLCNPELLRRASDESAEQPEQNEEPHEPWILANESLDIILAAAREFYGARTLGDILRADLSRIVSAANLDEAIDAIHLPDIDQPLVSQVVIRLANGLENSTSTEDALIDKRICVDQPWTLEQLARMMGHSREWIRKLEKKLKQSLNESVGASIGILADVVSEKIGAVTTDGELDRHIADLFSVNTHHTPAVSLARRMLRAKLDYSCHDGTCISQQALTVVRGLKDAATAIADDVGLIDEAALLPHLPDPEWAEHLPVLSDRCGLHRVSGRLALRTTARARAKAALMAIGRSATKEEIATIAELDPARIGGHLSNIPSVARADKHRWGLRDWIDDVYEGIPAEIVQRIDEDGGSTRLNRLLDELPRLFGVSEMSVRAYVATPAFRVEHGWVSVAEEPDFVVGRFRDVASGRDSSGDLYWTFPMHERYLRGFSVVGVPPELAVTLGCGFGRKSTVTVRSPQGSRAVSVNWRKTALTGPEIGRVTDSMSSLGAREGDLVQLVVHSEDEISFTRSESRAIDPAHNDGTAHRIPPIGSFTDNTRGAEGPYLGVRTGVPIAARLKMSSQSSATSRGQDPVPPSQPPTS